MTPLRLLPENPHYFEFRGKPTVLITSAEHYGSAVNPEFDFIAHLDELARCGFNQARVLSGTHIEGSGDFGIRDNTLAPRGDRLLCPWARGDVAGYAYGGNKFDLKSWDETYWERLKQIVAAAADRAIVIEISLFCMIYSEKIWAASPINPANTVNGGAPVGWQDVYNADQKALRAVMEKMAEKFLIELNGYDNVYFEVGNEIYEQPRFREFLEYMAKFLRETEDRLPNRHLIAVNYENRTKRITHPIPNVDVILFHYAIPSAVGENYHLAQPNIDDETGFKGPEIEPYRKEAWEFMIAGGAGFSHLDYSFTVDHPDGTHVVDRETPGIGGPEWRRQLTVLRNFVNDLRFWEMEPRNDLIKVVDIPPAMSISVLARIGVEYAVYIYGRSENVNLRLDIGQIRYTAEFIDPVSGDCIERSTIEGGYRVASIPLPEYTTDLVIRLRTTGSQ